MSNQPTDNDLFKQANEFLCERPSDTKNVFSVEDRAGEHRYEQENKDFLSEAKHNQQREQELYEALQRAVTAADTIILAACSGTVEEVDFLTVRMAAMWIEKVSNMATRRLLVARMGLRQGRAGGGK